MDDTTCGKPMLVKDFPSVCMIAGELDATLDPSCPPYNCQDPRATCTFEGCRTKAGECGLWVDAYSYSTGGWRDRFSVDLGCIVIDLERE